MRSALRSFALTLALAAATALVFDLAAWFLVPQELVRFASSYRKPELLSARKGHPALTRGADTPGYFVADDVLGFDIKPGVKAVHEFGEGPIEIFGNSLGCFDRNDVHAFRGSEYYYFAGDSFTWGFADYDSKFATVWERMTGKLAAKCGVAHTGQAAQFEKFKRVARTVGKMPAAVFVGYYVNDPANDAAYPHTTVIQGYSVDTVYSRGDELVRPDLGELKRAVEASIRDLEKPLTGLERARMTVWVYSLSANIALHALHAGRDLLGRAHATAVPAAAAAGTAPRATAVFGASFYWWHNPGAIKTSYATDPKTAANRAVIEEWARHARENGYRLVFLLFPLRQAFDDPELFAQLRAWLDTRGVEHMDFAQLFRRERFDGSALYWKDNGHWNANGNRVVGRLLAERYP